VEKLWRQNLGLCMWRDMRQQLSAAALSRRMEAMRKCLVQCDLCELPESADPQIHRAQPDRSPAVWLQIVKNAKRWN